MNPKPQTVWENRLMERISLNLSLSQTSQSSWPGSALSQIVWRCLAKTRCRTWAGVCLTLTCFFNLGLGSVPAIGPDEVLVVLNRNHPDGLKIGNYYRQQWQIPDRNVVRLNFSGNEQHITAAEFQKKIWEPVQEYLRAANLEDRIAVWVTTIGLPHRVGANSLSGAIFFGEEMKPEKSAELGPAGFRRGNGYANLLQPYRQLREQPVRPNDVANVPNGTLGHYLHMMLWAGDVESTLRLIDRSRQANPDNLTGTVYLLDGQGPRSSRKDSIPLARRLLQALNVPVAAESGHQLTGPITLRGLLTGCVSYKLEQHHFAPGALGDHLTSFGGGLQGGHNQMLCTEFLRAGCAASYGTVIEPYNYPQKFPTANLHAYYALGFTAVESYWMSVVWPQQGLFLGDPLTQPYVRGPALTLRGLEAGTVWTGATVPEVTIEAQAPDEGAGVSYLEVFLDGQPFQAKDWTKLPPNLQVSITVGNQSTVYRSSTQTTLPEVVVGLAQRLIKSDPKLKCLIRGGNLLLFRDGAETEPVPIQVQSNHPTLTVQVAREHFLPGEATELQAESLFVGQATAGDQIRLEMEEDGKLLLELEFATPAGLAAEVLSQLVQKWQDQLPTDYRLATVGRDKQAALILRVGNARSQRQPRIRWTIRTQGKGSDTLSSPNANQWLALENPQQAAQLAWIRFGVGQPSVSTTLLLPMDRLCEGSHELRLVAYRGWPSLPKTNLVVHFTKDEQPAGLRLATTSNAFTLSDQPTVVATAELVGQELVNGVGPKVHFYCDQQSIGVVSGPPYKATLIPQHWGEGTHTISAAILDESQPRLNSDNTLTVELRP